MFEKVNSSGADYTDRSQSIPLTFGESFTRGVKSNFNMPFAAIDAINNAMSDKPSESKALKVMQMYELEKEQGNLSGVGFFAGDMAAFVINPLTYVTGGVASVPVRAVGQSLAIKGATNAVAKFAYKGALIGSESVGAMIPTHVAAEYDQDKNKIDWYGVAQSAGIDFGIGAALPAVPFAWGMLRGKVKKTGVEATVPHEMNLAQADLDSALATKDINEAEHAFMSSVANKKPVPRETLNTIMEASGVPYDPASGHVNISLLEPKNIQAMTNSVTDSLGAQLGGDVKNSFNNYLATGDIGKIIKDPKIISGLRGFVDHINERLGKKEAHLAKMDEHITPYLQKPIEDSAPLSQAHLVELLAQGEKGALHIPQNVKKFLAEETELKAMGEKLRVLKEESVSLEGGMTPEARVAIEELQSRISNREIERTSLLKPTEEMAFIQSQLMKKDFEGKLLLDENYNRLMDLTHYWPHAKLLQSRIAKEEMYQKQSAFAKIAEQLVKASDNPDDYIVTQDDAVNYFKERISRRVKREKPVEAPPLEARDVDSLMKSATKEETKEALGVVKNRIDEFNNKKALRSFLTCVTGVAL